MVAPWPAEQPRQGGRDPEDEDTGRLGVSPNVAGKDGIGGCRHGSARPMLPAEGQVTDHVAS
jgi:hypothetical protein